MKFHSWISLLALPLIISCGQTMENTSTEIKAPIASKKDCVMTWHGHKRIDPYFWMRLTDEQKTAETPDNQTQEVLDYLNAENAYTESVMKHTEGFQEKLYKEIVGRIKQQDESVPYLSNG